MFSLYLCALIRGVEEKLYICDCEIRADKYQLTEIGEKVEKVIGYTGNYKYTDRLTESLRNALKDNDPVQTSRILEFVNRNKGKIAQLGVYNPIPAAVAINNQYRQPNYPAEPIKAAWIPATESSRISLGVLPLAQGGRIWNYNSTEGAI